MKKFTSILLGAALSANMIVCSLNTYAAEEYTAEPTSSAEETDEYVDFPIIMGTQLPVTTETTTFTTTTYETTTTADETAAPTTTTVCFDEPEKEFTVSPVFKVSGGLRENFGLDMTLKEYEISYVDRVNEPTRILASWNTDEENPYTIPAFTPRIDCYYVFESSALPEGTSWEGRKNIRYEILYDEMTNVFSYGDPLCFTAEIMDVPPMTFPASGSIETSFHFIDAKGNTEISGLDIEIVKLNDFGNYKYTVGDVIAKWTTSDDTAQKVEMPYYFEALGDNNVYGIRISNETKYNSSAPYDYETGCIFFVISSWDVLRGSVMTEQYFYLKEDISENITTSAPGTPVGTSTTTTTDDPLDEPVIMTTTLPDEDVRDTTTAEPISTDDTTTQTTTTTTTTDLLLTTSTAAKDDTTTTTTASGTKDSSEAAVTTTLPNVSESDEPAKDEGELPQTGYPKVYKNIAAAAVPVLIGGAFCILISKRKRKYNR